MRIHQKRAIAGSYPEALARVPGRRRNQWLDNYVARIVERDAPDISNFQRQEQSLMRMRPWLDTSWKGSLPVRSDGSSGGQTSRCACIIIVIESVPKLT